MMKNNFNFLIALTVLPFLFYNCGTSTGSRYSQNEKVKTNDSLNVASIDQNNIQLKEDFDITPFKTKIEVPERKKINSTDKKEIWYDYGSSVSDQHQKILIGTEDGFRVTVITTDNLDDANQIKSDLISKTGNNEVYIDFEPPFYKVKVGDFKDHKSAEDLRFKLNQIGYKEAKVVKETINIFK